MAKAKLLQLKSVKHNNPRYVLYTAVLPAYRENCMKVLTHSLGSTFAAYTGDAHLDPTVRTGISAQLYTAIKNHRLLTGRILLQTGRWISTIRAETAILDLNPRSLTAWVLLIVRRGLGKRTLLWGHLHPQRGGASRTAALRRSMRRLASGTVLYGYGSVISARADLANAPVWVAPNSLYFRSDIAVSNESQRREILYVGRLEPAKKLPLLMHGFAQSGLHHQGYRLSIVGHGSQLDELQALAQELSITHACDFVGRVYDTESIKRIYARSACSVSPGYAGLSLTQSIGFGVPVLVADDEPHSPEIELDRTGAVSYFTSDSPAALADALIKVCDVDHAEESGGWSRTVANSYSAESMAQGLVAAYKNESQSLEENGWPPNEP